MRKSILLLIGLFALISAPNRAHAQGSPNILWQQSVNSDRINAIIFNYGGDTVISGSSDRLINFWRASDGTLLRTLNTNAAYIHDSAIESLSITRDGTRLASASFQVVKLWNLSTGIAKDLTGHTDWVVGVSFSADGQYLASASFDNTVKVWRGTDGMLLQTLSHTFPRMMRCVAFSPDASLLAAGGAGGVLNLYRTSDWTLLGTLRGHTDDIYSIAFSPDGTKLVTGAYDRTARVWDMPAGTLLQTFNAGGHVYGVAFTSDSRRIAFGDGEGNSVQVYRISDGVRTQFYTTETPQVQCVAISKDDFLAYGRVDKVVTLARLGTATTPPAPPTTPVPPPPTTPGEPNNPNPQQPPGNPQEPPPTTSNWYLSTSVIGSGTISATPQPNGPNGSYLPGTLVQLTAVPSGTNIFFQWTGAVTASTPTISVTVNGNISLAAHFTEPSRAVLVIMNKNRQLVPMLLENGKLKKDKMLRNGAMVGLQWTFVGMEDLNQDGSPDYIFQDKHGRLAVWLMRGTEFVTAVWLRGGHSPGQLWKAVSTSDMNGDGHPDILFQNKDGRTAIWLMRGTEFQNAQLLNDGRSAAPGWRITSTGDINGDGHADIIWQNVTTGETVLWTMNRTQRTGVHRVKDGKSYGAKWRVSSVKDFNDDGKPDLLLQNIVDGRMVIWYMNNEKFVGRRIL